MTKLLLFAITLVLAALWLLTLLPVGLGGRAGFIMVDGRSMEPTFHTGDFVITHKQSSYEVGDVVAFHAENGRVIHRIIGGNGVDGYLLQGDNNNFADPWLPTDAGIIGKQWLSFPGGSKYVRALRGPEAMAGFFAFLITAGMVGQNKARPRRTRGVALLTRQVS